MELMAASNQWASRPADERFLSIDDMVDHFQALRERSAERLVSSRSIHIRPAEADPIRGLEITGASGMGYSPTNWAFGQIATKLGAPTRYLKSLPSPIVADALNWGLRELASEDSKVLIRQGRDEAPAEFSALTSPKYGRIWNLDVLKQVQRRFGNGRDGDWTVPGEFGKAVEITKANTTLYAGDRDFFIFLADEKHKIAIPNRRNGEPGELSRGFFMWNSEVGAQTMGIAMFLFDYACCNRIVWGAREFREIKIRHTISAPDKFIDLVRPVMDRMSSASPEPIERMLLAARKAKLDDPMEWLAKRYSPAQAEALNMVHLAEEARPVETLWDVSTALTAQARGIAWQDRRVEAEREAGMVLDMVDDGGTFRMGPASLEDLDL